MRRPAHRVLVVDADARSSRALQLALAEGGLQAEAVASLASLQAAGVPPPELLVFDIDLPAPAGRPAPDGLAQLRGLRLGCSLPLIVLCRSADLADRVMALDSGADDVLCKPVASRELLARIDALMRRARAGAGSAPVATRWQAGHWTLDAPDRMLSRDGGWRVPLTEAEFRLMRAFFERPRRVLQRADLLALAAPSGPASAQDSRSLDLLVSRLRGKLGDDARAPRWLHTVRGSGYRFVPGEPD